MDLLTPPQKPRVKNELSKSPQWKTNHMQKNRDAIKNIEHPYSYSNTDFEKLVAPKVHPSKIDVQSRFYKYKERVNEKLEKIAKDVSQEEMKECTFKPKIKGDGSRRTVQEFVNEMQKFEKQKQEKLKAMREESEKVQHSDEHPHKPQICEKSMQILAKKGENASEPVYEKLYKSSKQPKKSESESSSTEKLPFKPTVNQKSRELIRTEPIDKHLYEDALRRINKEPEAPPKTQKEKFANAKSIEVLAEKLEKEFNSTFEALDPDCRGRLNYSVTVNFLQQLYFINNNPENPRNDDEKSLVVKMWRLLGGDESGTVSKENLKTFVLAVMDCYISNEAGDNEASNLTTSIGKLVDGEFVLLKNEVNRLHRAFYMFYENRSSHKTSTKKYKSKVEYSFRPQIDEASLKLAENVRTNRTQETGSRTKHEDYLISEKQKLQDKLEQLKKELQKKETEECTFKPTVTEMPSYQMAKKEPKDSLSQDYKKLSEEHKSTHRTELLYNLSGSQKRRKEQLAKTGEELEAQKDKEECTFAPKIEKPTVYEETDLYEKKGVNEFINKLQKGRRNKEFFKSMTERGYPYEGELKPLQFGVDKGSKSKSIFSPSSSLDGSSKFKKSINLSE